MSSAAATSTWHQPATEYSRRSGSVSQNRSSGSVRCIRGLRLAVGSALHVGLVAGALAGGRPFIGLCRALGRVLAESTFAFRSSFAELFDFDFSSSAPELFAFRSSLPELFVSAHPSRTSLGRSLSVLAWPDRSCGSCRAVAPGPFARLRLSSGHVFRTVPLFWISPPPWRIRRGRTRRHAVLFGATGGASALSYPLRRSQANAGHQCNGSKQKCLPRVAFHRESSLVCSMEQRSPFPRIRERNRCGRRLCSSICYARSHDVFHSILRAAFAQMSPIARFAYFLPISGTELRVPLLAQ